MLYANGEPWIFDLGTGNILFAGSLLYSETNNSIILSVPTANYSSTTTGSPTVTTSGNNTILKFNGSGSYTA